MTDLHRRYYALAAGTWRGTFSVSVDRLTSLLTARLGWRETATVLGMALLDRLLGPAELTTRITPLPDGRLRHDAWLSRGRWRLTHGIRSFTLTEDGVSWTVAGVEHRWPAISTPIPLAPGTGRAEDPRRAVYRMPIGGPTWTVRFVIGERLAWSTVTLPGVTAVESLQRVGPTPDGLSAGGEGSPARPAGPRPDRSPSR